MARRHTKIRHLVPVNRAGGRVTYKWEPSTKLRRLGYKTVMLGDDLVSAIQAAEALNAELDAWRAGAADKAGARTVAPANRFHSTWADLEREFRADQEHGLPSKKPKTQREYESRMKWLRSWAEDGRTRLSDIDTEVAMDLRNTLVRHNSPFKAAAILRVFSLLMSYAEFVRMIPRGSDPAKRLKVPSPPRRRKRIAYETVEFLAATARERGMEGTALAIELGFFTMQRPSDLRLCGRMHWRRMNDLAARDRAALCGPDGLVYGLRLKQAKTGAWVGCALQQDMRAKVEARLADMEAAGFNYILFHDGDGQGAGGLWHERQFNRDFRTIVDAARTAAESAGDGWLVDQLTGLQYRDLRRSGMGWAKDNGATKEQIAARSGHKIKEVEEILETYMPADERGSAAAFATALLGSQQRTQERNEG